MLLLGAWIIVVFPLACLLGILQALFPTRECQDCGHRGWNTNHDSCPRCGAWGTWWKKI
jgi:rubrerythrin